MGVAYQHKELIVYLISKIILNSIITNHMFLLKDRAIGAEELDP